MSTYVRHTFKRFHVKEKSVTIFSCFNSTESDQAQTTLLSEAQNNELRSTVKILNEDQRKALDRCLSAQDYVMILGMPGTGKTTAIACLAKVLVILGKSVLITSYTHTAVDNILLKLKQVNLDLTFSLPV